MTHAAADAGRQPVRTLLLAAALLFASILPAAAAEDSGFGKGLLWRVSMPGVPASYIFGTFHSADPALATPSPAVRKVLDRVDRVMIEVVSSPGDDEQKWRATFLTDGRRLSDITGPERFRQVVEVGARYGIPAENLESLRPWGATGVFSIPPSELQRQAGGGETLDAVIVNIAKQRGIPVFGIETAAEQIAAFAGDSEADQLVMLYAVLDSNARIEVSFKKLKQAYLAGDLARLHDLAYEDTGSAPIDVVDRFFQRLIWDRNHRMVERVLPHLAEGNILVAVGALHLYGDKGLPGLLAQRGYDVSPVR